MQFSVPYLLLMACYAFLAWQYNRSDSTERRTYNVLLCVAITLFFFGLRGFVMHDWYSYYGIFQSMEVSRFSFLTDYDCEKGFAFLIFLCKSYYPNYHFFVFVITFFEVVLLTRFFVRHVSNVPLALMICFSVGFLGVFMDLLRNGLSICIFLNALDYLRDRKPLKYFLVCLLALLFHNSAAVYFPLYFFLHRKASTKLLVTAFSLGILVFVLRIPVFMGLAEAILSRVDPQMNFYLKVYFNTEDYVPSPINFVFLERVATGVLALYYLPKLRTMRPDANIYINALFLFLCIHLWGYEFVTASSRISHLFEYGLWVGWFDLFRCLNFRGNQKLAILAVCAYCTLRMIGVTKQRPVAEYDNILFDSKNIHERQNIFNRTFQK